MTNEACESSRYGSPPQTPAARLPFRRRTFRLLISASQEAARGLTSSISHPDVNKMHSIFFIMTALASIVALVRPSFSADHVYRILSSVTEAGEKKMHSAIARRIAFANSDGFRWQDIPGHPAVITFPTQLTGTGESFETSVVITDRELPPVPVVLKIKEERIVKLNRGAAVLYSFDAAGKMDAVAGESDGPAVRAVSIKGEGIFLMDENKRTPLAGRMHFIRHAAPALWRAARPGDDYISEIETAWAVVP